MKRILTFLVAMSVSASVMASEPSAHNTFAADMTGLPRKVFAAKTVKVEWRAKCANYGAYDLKGTPTPWHKHGIQFTTISGQKIIVTIGADCIFLKVPKR